MKIHHLNCATMCPPFGSLINEEARMVCHCLLVETERAGLVLVDTGLGTEDLARPRERLGGWFQAVTRPRLLPEETALAQVRALGYAADDVRHIVVTHLDLDHAGGLPDFPGAVVHVFADEHEAAMHPTGRERLRYRPAHWAHGPRWAPHPWPAEGEPWMGFSCVRDLDGLPPEILLVPLVGHSRGHSAVAVRAAEGWLLHCGDAYFYRGEMDPEGRRCTTGLDLFQRAVEVDGAARRRNQERLRQLARDRAAEVRVFSAHDPEEWRRLAGPAA